MADWNATGAPRHGPPLTRGASRPARRLQTPAAVLNLHRQFELLREARTYQTPRANNLERDMSLAGITPRQVPHGTGRRPRPVSTAATRLIPPGPTGSTATPKPPPFWIKFRRTPGRPSR
jgi:hypothetical protein